MKEPCQAAPASANPDIDLQNDIKTMKCIGFLRYQVLGLQTTINKMIAGAK